MLRSLVLVAFFGACITFPAASALDRLSPGQQTPCQEIKSSVEKDYIEANYTCQLKDHANPSEGTFSQRYYFSDKYYKGQGSPIIIQIAGEGSVEGFQADLIGDSMTVAMMKAWGAAGVVLEHRYFGVSSPSISLTTSNLKFLTVEQAIEDYKYFMENVQLPWTSGNYTTHPGSTPWVSIGCSYPGLLVALLQQQYPDLLAGGYSSSAPINADGNFQEYWEPIEAGMPKNCSSDLAEAVAHIDNVMSTGPPEDVLKLKTRFGLQDLANDDFGAALQFPLSQWQGLQAAPVDDGPVFYEFCDEIETKNGGAKNMEARGVGMPQALDNWAEAFQNLILPKIKKINALESLITSNPQAEIFTNTDVVDDHRRAWTWMLCTQLGWFQVGKTSSIASSLVTPAYFERQCSNYFPLTNGTRLNYSLSQAVDKFNDRFGSWNTIGKNLFVTNGEFDPWRPASFSADEVPSAIANLTETGRITLIRGATHCWDLSLINGEHNEHVKEAQDKGLTQIHNWLQNWYTNHPDVPNNLLEKVSTSGKEDLVDETPNDINATHDTVLHDLEDKMEVLAEAKGWGQDFLRFAEISDLPLPEQ